MNEKVYTHPKMTQRENTETHNTLMIFITSQNTPRVKFMSIANCSL